MLVGHFDSRSQPLFSVRLPDYPYQKSARGQLVVKRAVPGQPRKSKIGERYFISKKVFEE